MRFSLDPWKEILFLLYCQHCGQRSGAVTEQQQKLLKDTKMLYQHTLCGLKTAARTSSPIYRHILRLFYTKSYRLKLHSVYCEEIQCGCVVIWNETLQITSWLTLRASWFLIRGLQHLQSQLDKKNKKNKTKKNSETKKELLSPVRWGSASLHGRQQPRSTSTAVWF